MRYALVLLAGWSLPACSDDFVEPPGDAGPACANLHTGDHNGDGGAPLPAPAPIAGAELVHVSSDQSRLLYRTDAQPGDIVTGRHGALWLKTLPEGPPSKVAEDASIGGIFGDTVVYWAGCGIGGCVSTYIKTLRMSAPMRLTHGINMTSQLLESAPERSGVPFGSAGGEIFFYSETQTAWLLRTADCSDRGCAPTSLDELAMDLSGAATSPDGRYLVYSLVPRGLLVGTRLPEAWLLVTTDMRRVALPQPAIRAADFAPGGDRVAIVGAAADGTGRGEVTILRLPDGAPVPMPVPPADYYEDVIHQDDGALLLSTLQGGDRILYRITEAGAAEVLRHPLSTATVRLVRRGPQKGRIALRITWTAPGSTDLQFWFDRLDRAPGCGLPIRQALKAWSASEPPPVSDDGDRVMLFRTSTIALWDPATGEIAEYDAPNVGPFLPGSHSLLILGPTIVGWQPQEVRIWDGVSERLVHGSVVIGQLIARPGRLYFTALDSRKQSRLETFDSR